MPWAALVFDEAHYLKNHTSARSRIARELTSAATALAPKEPAVYLLTGTPLTNRPRDLFVLLQLAGHPLGRSFLSFAKRYCAAEKTEYGWKTDGASNLAELTVQLHGTMLRRTKEEVLSLPPKLRTWLPTTVAAGVATREIRESSRCSGPRSGATAAMRHDRARTSCRSSRGPAEARRHQVDTLDLVRGAVEQGEGHCLLCFDEPLRRSARRRSPTGRCRRRRQGSSIGFKQDERCACSGERHRRRDRSDAHAAAGGLLRSDWVGRSRQAEDRARIGQTDRQRHLPVAEETIDEFRAGGARGKGRARPTIVGESRRRRRRQCRRAERALAAISPGLADVRAGIEDEVLINDLVRVATEQWRNAHPSGTASETSSADPAAARTLRAALEALARVLAGPSAQRFRIASSSKPGSHYTIDAAGGDVTCSCPGFEHRGQCHHVRDVKTALASGIAPPPDYVAVG